MPRAGFEPADPSYQEAADLRLRPRGHRNLPKRTLQNPQIQNELLQIVTVAGTYNLHYALKG
jgi:hypothetical protein